MSLRAQRSNPMEATRLLRRRAPRNDGKGIKLTVIGSGHMGSALISGLIRNRLFRPAEILAVDRDRVKLRSIQKSCKIQTATDIKSGRQAKIVLLAVKPQDIASVLGHCRKSMERAPLYLSIAAGIRTVAIQKILGSKARIIRAMPNLPALVGKGVAGLYANANARPADCRITEKIFRAVGSCFWVQRETQLDAVTALSGSGPAYVFGLMAAMTSAGKKLGLPGAEINKIVADVVMGAAALALQSGKDPEALRIEVTSKKGTTEAAFKILASRRWQKSLADAIMAAHRRAREIGDKQLKG